MVRNMFTVKFWSYLVRVEVLLSLKTNVGQRQIQFFLFSKKICYLYKQHHPTMVNQLWRLQKCTNKRQVHNFTNQRRLSKESWALRLQNVEILKTMAKLGCSVERLSSWLINKNEITKTMFCVWTYSIHLMCRSWHLLAHQSNRRPKIKSNSANCNTEN